MKKKQDISEDRKKYLRKIKIRKLKFVFFYYLILFYYSSTCTAVILTTKLILGTLGLLFLKRYALLPQYVSSSSSPLS